MPQASAGLNLSKASRGTVRKAQTKVLDVNVALALKRGQKAASGISSSTTATTLGTSSLRATASSSAPRQPFNAGSARPSNSAAVPSAATRPSASDAAPPPPIDSSGEANCRRYSPYLLMSAAVSSIAVQC